MTNTAPRIVESYLLGEVVAILERQFDTKILINTVQQISEPDRRNVLLRIILDSPQKDVPTSIILKQALWHKSYPEEKEVLGRFARDWAGLEFLSNLNCPIVPKVYGSSSNHRFVLLQDLGEMHVSLVDSLMGTDPEAATAALKRFAHALGQLHADAFKHTARYKKLLSSLNPSLESFFDYLEEKTTKLKTILERFNLTISDELNQEIEEVYKICKEKNQFMTLVHGDICPDNVFDDPDQKTMHIIDFEWGFVGNALLDGTYWRMSNPTCWCVKALPEDIIVNLEGIYRKELMKKIPAALDDELYNESYVSACAYWVLTRLTALEDILERDVDIHPDKPLIHPTWKPEYKLQRPRTLARLEAFIKVSNHHDRLPHLRQMSVEILEELKTRWQEVEPLQVYPAFAHLRSL